MPPTPRSCGMAPRWASRCSPAEPLRPFEGDHFRHADRLRTTASVTVTDDVAKAGESSVAYPFVVNGVAPANDNIANAIAITTSSFTTTVDNSAATTESTDPTPTCATGSTNPRTKTVWWSLTPAASGTVAANTIGSAYDTTLSVWTGTPGGLTQVACNDDIPNSPLTQSQPQFFGHRGHKVLLDGGAVWSTGHRRGVARRQDRSKCFECESLGLESSSPSSRSVAAGLPGDLYDHGHGKSLVRAGLVPDYPLERHAAR